jgi:hypothetical protein
LRERSQASSIWALKEHLCFLSLTCGNDDLSPVFVSYMSDLLEKMISGWTGVFL